MSGDFLALAQPGVQQLSPYVPGKPVDELARELDLDPATVGGVTLVGGGSGFGGMPDVGALARLHIADELFISKRTVDKHRANILEKTGCKNTASLVVYAIRKSKGRPVSVIATSTDEPDEQGLHR